MSIETVILIPIKPTALATAVSMLGGFIPVNKLLNACGGPLDPTFQ